MGTPTKSKRKGLVKFNHQPLKIDDRAASQATQGESTTGADKLQTNKKAAAKEFVEIYQKIEDAGFEITPGKAYEQYAIAVWSKHVCCTPVTVMFKFQGEWIGMSLENVEEACKEIAEIQEVRPEFYAKLALRDVRYYAKKAGRVGWVLPKLGREVVE